MDIGYNIHYSPIALFVNSLYGGSMHAMSHRERVLAALSHQAPDRVPIDLGSMPVTGISLKAYDRLKTYLGLDLGETKVYDRGSQLAQVDREVFEILGIDTRGVKPGASSLRPDVDSLDQDAYTDEWGMLHKRVRQDDVYFVTSSPLSGEISARDIVNYPWPVPDDPGRVAGLKEQILVLRAEGDWAIVLSLPSSFIQQSQLLRGFEDWFYDAATDTARLCVLLDQVMEIQMATCGYILDAVGSEIDVVFSYDDLAMQDRLIVSPAMYRSLLEPRLAKFIAFLRSKSRAKIVHHTDGAVASILPSLAAMGIDAVNPVQVSAKGMDDTAELKRQVGERLAFWGGIDTQRLLPFGKPEEVRADTLRRIRDLNQNGGYVLGSVHNIQGDVPVENLIAMYEAALNKQIRAEL